MNILRYLHPIRVTDRIYNRFVNTGVVDNDIIRLLALKVMKGKDLSQNEQAIFFGKT